MTDENYYRKRSAAQFELARRAAAPFLARIHKELAKLYLDRAAEPKERTKPELLNAKRTWTTI